jgi:hypothetical protein
MELPPMMAGTAHCALDDARHLKYEWEYLRGLEYRM